MGGTRHRRVEPTDEWEQLKLLCRWPEQLAYEEIRPTVLFGSSVRDRAANFREPPITRTWVNTLTFLSKETGIDAFLVKWLDKLPHHPADRGDGDARGALDRLTVLAVVVRVTEVDPSEIPRTDPVVLHVPPYRRLEIAHDDPQLHRFVEDGLAH